MGRNAKFYKSHKSKKKESSTQKQITGSSSAAQTSIKSKVQKRNDRIINAKASSDGEDDQEGISNQRDDNYASLVHENNKLKSKLWRDLEAKRAKEGKSEYTTPKEAGIDYLRQWEKRGR